MCFGLLVGLLLAVEYLFELGLWVDLCVVLCSVVLIVLLLFASILLRGFWIRLIYCFDIWVVSLFVILACLGLWLFRVLFCVYVFLCLCGW